MTEKQLQTACCRTADQNEIPSVCRMLQSRDREGLEPYNTFAETGRVKKL